MLHRRTVLAGCALAVTALAMGATPAMAEPNNSPASSAIKPPPAMVEAMQRDLGLTPAQVDARLANEAKAMATDAKVRAAIGDAYAGSWVSGATSESFIVATSDASKAGAILAAGAQPKIVGRSLSSLESTVATLDKAASKAPDSTRMWYVDVRSNSVVVLSSNTAEAEAFVAASGVDKSAVRVEQSNEQPQLFYDLRGGDAYYINNSARCSIGFSVRRGSTNGFVSAGHCGRAGNTTTGYNRVAQGTFQGSSFPGNDYSWIAVNSNWTPTNYISYGNVRVTGSSVAAVGSSICRAGSTTGWRCGIVQQFNATVRYSQGTVSGLTRTNACAEPGDSGGSFVSGSQAQGMTSGGSGNCSVGGTTYFQPVNEALSAYGLTLVTS
ncbi:serine protease [Microbispora rosea subsp. aerata]|nr:S1 family peptidase [Microbispora rosea]GGO11829.1 serine protease [Microbispora rosea subsp. aerata]GIH55696.1 serine protease [Microbispora rosea subsp. aerata]GLJ86006.1 serine protease [Microbispora rosea subsp. aerata]